MGILTLQNMRVIISIKEKVEDKDQILIFFNHAEGYIKKYVDDDNFSYVYQYKDHLGNVRLSYTDANKDGTIVQSEIIEESHYYPFGLKMKGFNNVIAPHGNSVAQKFGYNGIELEESLGLNLHETEFRMYDPAIGRFTAIDPVTHYSMSTYTAFDNNPIYWADPSGADGESFVGDYFADNGNSNTPASPRMSK